MEDNKVAILLEDIKAQFRAFGEGLDGLRNEMKSQFNNLEKKLDDHILQNRKEHLQLMQMIKELDKEVQVEIKRAK